MHVDADGIMQERLRDMPIDSDIWRKAYPALVNILDDDPGAPKGNVIRHNISWQGKWLSMGHDAEAYPTFEDNLIDVDPLFVDAARGDYRLRDESPAFKLGFEPLPLDQIGLIEDDTRASWPVRHALRAADGKHDGTFMDQ